MHGHKSRENKKNVKDTPAIMAKDATAKSGKQANCRNFRWMDTDNRVHIHNAIFLNYKEVGNNAKSSHRKEIRDDHSKWSKGNRDRQASYDITSKCNRKMDENELLF